jgi:hypothetical protein
MFQWLTRTFQSLGIWMDQIPRTQPAWAFSKGQSGLHKYATKIHPGTTSIFDIGGVSHCSSSTPLRNSVNVTFQERSFEMSTDTKVTIILQGHRKGEVMKHCDDLSSAQKMLAKNGWEEDEPFDGRHFSDLYDECKIVDGHILFYRRMTASERRVMNAKVRGDAGSPNPEI